MLFSYSDGTRKVLHKSSKSLCNSRLLIVLHDHILDTCFHGTFYIPAIKSHISSQCYLENKKNEN